MVSKEVFEREWNDGKGSFRIVLIKWRSFVYADKYTYYVNEYIKLFRHKNFIGSFHLEDIRGVIYI